MVEIDIFNDLKIIKVIVFCMEVCLFILDSVDNKYCLKKFNFGFEGIKYLM